MNFNMKNRIWKNLSAMSMAFFMTGMVLGGCGQTTVYAAELAYESVEFEEHSETEETGIEEAGIEESGIEESGTDESDPDEIQSEENAEETEPEETEDSEEKDQDKANLSDGKSEEEDKENENKKKTPNFTVSVVTDESTVKAGSDLVYTVTLENTGDVMLKNIQLRALFSNQNLQGEWSGDNLEQLDVGIRKERYLTVNLPEELEVAVSVKILASAEVEMTEADTEDAVINRETSLDTKIIPLEASFEVTKTADRSVAVPGDKILFQICIRNTGERTLHSVVTTERFQLGNVPVQFLEKEGVLLNNSKTKARIEKIEPGKAAGLQAMVTLPENLKEQELLNEVTVTTLETGEQVMTSQAKIQIRAAEEVETEEADRMSGDMDNSAVSHTGESYPVSMAGNDPRFYAGCVLDPQTDVITITEYRYVLRQVLCSYCGQHRTYRTYCRYRCGHLPEDGHHG